MKLGLGLYRQLLTPETLRFARQAGVTHIVAHLPGYFVRENAKIITSDQADHGFGVSEADDPIWTAQGLRDLKASVNAERLALEAYFKKTVYPLLIPLPLGQGHSFPHISNLYLNLAVVLQDRKGAVRLMRLQVPDTLPRLFPVKRSSGRAGKNGKASSTDAFLWLEEIIIATLAAVFPEDKVLAVHPFRIIRDAALRVDDLETYDPLDTIEESIQQLNIQRQEFGAVMQVVIYEEMPGEIRSLLSEFLQVDPQDFYVKGSPLGLRSLWELYNAVDRDDLKYRPYKPVIFRALKQVSRPRHLFVANQQRDILLHPPYDSFSQISQSCLAIPVTGLSSRTG